MNQELWNKILAFDFDHPPSEYGFSIRLAKENYWTKSFTEQAILEYKKFMYLAATSDFMVSPSEIVDTVWHQHLIFTHSYQDFCTLLNKQIQHIPSTHNKEDFEKFKQAKERTAKFYERDFGPQPDAVWGYNTMFDSLHLQKAKLKIRTFVIIGILAFILITIPVYFLLRPIYIHLYNPFFVFNFTVLSMVVFLVLEVFNRYRLKSIVASFSPSSFVYHLQPMELMYCSTQKLSNVVNGTVNELIANGTIKVSWNHTMQLTKTNATKSREQLQVTSTLSELGTTHYPNLLKRLVTKPIFSNTANCMDAFRKYFNKSKKFGTLFYINFSVLAVLLLLSFTRIVTGILRDKPVLYIFVISFFLVIGIIVFLRRLTLLISTTTIPNIYRNKILPAQQMDKDMQWSYFLLGKEALAASFIPLVTYASRSNARIWGSGSSCGTSCGSGCGTSCGSSCGGCGGCGGD